MASVADCKTIAETKVKDLQEAITAATGVPVSKKDTQKVYSTRTNYDDAAGDNNGFIYHVSENECSLYTRSYDDGTAPSLVSDTTARLRQDNLLHMCHGRSFV